MSNDNLKSYVDEFFDELTLYDDYYNGHDFKGILKSGIDVFLENKTNYTAFSVYEIFLMIYQITPEDKSAGVKLTQYPNTPLDFARVMQKHSNSFFLIRDTFIHSVEVFILGLAIYSQNKDYRKAFESHVRRSPYEKYYRIEDEFSNEEFLYRWGIASLFFDIAGPIEIKGDKPFRTSLNDEINSILTAQGESLHFNFIDLNELDTIPKIDFTFGDEYASRYTGAKFLDMFKPTELLAFELARDFNLDKRKQNEIKNILNRIFKYGDCPCRDPMIIDHGFVSSICVLKIYAYLIQTHQKRQEFFFYPVLDSAKAILLHTFYRNVLQKRPFNLLALHPQQNPLAFLLILCDEVLSGVGQGNGVNFLIDDKRFEIDYISRSIEGIPFAHDIEAFINSVLSVRSLFTRGLGIYMDVQINDGDVLKEIIKSDIKHQQLSIRDTENFAVEFNKRFSPPEVGAKSFDELPSDVIVQSIKEARSVSRRLNLIGCELADAADPREAIGKFSDEDLLDMAILEHEIWCEDKIAQGWKYGETKDNAKKITPFLVPWEKLSHENQKYNLEAVGNIPHLVESFGLKIVRRKLTLLCLERNKYLQNGVGYEYLDRTSWQINLILTNALVKSLNELKYDLVDIDEANHDEIFLKEEDIEYLAEREHSKWMNIKLRLGWRYASVYDDELKEDPNIVSFYALDYKVKRHKIDEFRMLGRLCENAGLKIIKIDDGGK